MSYGYHFKKHQKFFYNSIRDERNKHPLTSAYQIFLKTPQKRAMANITAKDKELTYDFINNHNIKLFIHTGYLFNIGDEIRNDYCIRTGVDDMIQGHVIGAIGVVFHVGKHCKRCTPEQSMKHMITYINTVINMTSYISIKFLLETGAGCGTEVCRSINDLKYIYDHIEIQEKFGFCIDTCHIFAAGFDIRDKPNDYIEEFDEKIGLDKVCLIHLNDSKGELKSCVDRHDNLLYGKIGIKGLSTFVKKFYSLGVPIVLETPNNKKRKSDLKYIEKWINT